MTTLTLLTDFGTTDYYVAAVKGTVLRLAGAARAVRLVDLSHDLPAGDVDAAADLLGAAAPTFPAGTVHLAVVDPGVGSERRILAVRSGGHLFVAPDNGLLTPILSPPTAPVRPDGASRADRAGPPDRDEPPQVHGVTRADLFLPGPGSTFHGRDRFAPTAAALLRGEPLDSLGPRIGDPVLLDHPAPRQEETDAGPVLHGRVRRIDRFGNLVTDIPAAWLDATATGDGAAVRVGGHGTRRWVGHYAELPTGEAGALVGSLGTVELSLRGRSLATHWGVERGAPVRIETAAAPSPTG